jgi:hypothetical protein
MNRSDYGYAPLAYDQYESIISTMEVFKDANGNKIVSPLHGTSNWSAADAQCKQDNVDMRVDLAAILFEDHGGTDPGGGVELAKVYNFSGIKWAGQSGAYDSGIAAPANEGGTYAAFHDFGGFIAELHRTLNNEYCGPAFKSGDLTTAWAIYVGGPNNPNIAAGASRVAQWHYYLNTYPPPPEGSNPVSTTVYASAVVAAALKHLGDAHEYDSWNGDHAVSMFCLADVEDWYAEAGLTVPHYGTAAQAGDAVTLNSGHAPAGAQVFFRGPGWSQFDHTGISLGDGRTISGLTTVVISAGWQDLDTYRGWWMPPGVLADPTQNVFYIEGNPNGTVPLEPPFWNRWNALNQLGLALPMMGYAMGPERTLPSGRRIQQFERGWYGTQPAPDPWDIVALLPAEVPSK